MSCKTYDELKNDFDEYVEVDNIEYMDRAFKKAKEAEYADLADAYMYSKAALVDTLNSATPYYNKVQIEILDYFDRRGKKYITYKYPKSKKQYTLFVGEYSPLTFKREGVTFEATARNMDMLMSDAEFVYEGENQYEERVVDSINNPESVLALGKELYELYGKEDGHQKMLLSKLEEVSKVLARDAKAVVVKVNENASKTNGQAVFNADKADVYINVGPRDVEMSPLEVYVHELNHVMVKAALDSKDPIFQRDIRALKQLRAKMIKDFTAEDVMGYMSTPNKKVAEAMLNYFSDRNVGLYEFVAYADTNATVRAMLANMTLDREKVKHENWASMLSEVLARILDKILGVINRTSGKNGIEIAEGAIIGLTNANRRAQNNKRNIVFGRMVAPFLKLESAIVKYVDEKEAKYETINTALKSLNETSNWKSIKNLAVDTFKATVNKNYADTVAFSFSLLGLKPEGTIRTMLRDMSKSDVVMDLAEKLGLMSQSIDRTRQTIETAVKKLVKEGFTRELNKLEKDALTETLMDTDISVIADRADFEKLFSDSEYLKEQINKSRAKLKSVSEDDKAFNYYKNQADGLGFFMINGTTSSYAQLLNAENIARRLDTGKDKEKANKGLIEAIDELATLHALAYTNEESRLLVADLLNTEAIGVKNIIGYQAAHKESLEKNLFKYETDKIKLIKGYSKETYSQDVDYLVDLKENEAEMKKKGYKKVRDLEPNRLDSSKPMALYVSTMNVRQNLHRVALRYTDKGRRGTSIRDKYALDAVDTLRSKRAARDIAFMRNEMLKQAAEMESDTYRAGVDGKGLLPMFNNVGKVVDFRYVLSKKSKIEELQMKTDIETVLGRTYSNRYDKEESMKLNDEVMELIVSDAKAHIKEGSKDLFAGVDKGLLEYVEIAKDSDNAEIRDIWAVLPDNVQKQFPSGFIMRRELMHMLLGYREISVANMPGVTALPESIKHGVRVAEKIWKDIIAISKKNIVLKLPQVLIGNVISNIGISVMSGFNPFKVAQLQAQGVGVLNQWIKANRELTQLKVKVAAGQGTTAIERRIGVLENEIRHNPATVLVDEGFYTSILEEIEVGVNEDKNIVTRTASELLARAPKLIRNGAELLYLADDTAFMRFMSSATQYSDFVARYAQYHLLLSRGVSHEAAAKEVRDAYINYNKPNSRALEWANQMGFVMFTKYFTRIQKAIRQHIRTHPLKVLGAVLAQEWVIGDIDDFTDQSLVAKDLGNIFYSPADQLWRAITPQWDNALDGVRRML